VKDEEFNKELEVRVKDHGLANVLDALADICESNAGQMEEDGDKESATVWSDDSDLIREAADGIRDH